MSTLASLRDRASALVATYVDPSGHYAYRTYDHLYGYEGPLLPSDVLMANLLSLRLTWTHVTPLFAEGTTPATRLRETLDVALADLRDAQAFEDHEDLSTLEQTLAPLAAANSATETVKDWTAVTVSKVMHRRRPHIVPLIDSRVREFYGVRGAKDVRAALWEDLNGNREWLAPLAATQRTPDGRALTLLRLADILIWTPS